MSEADSTERRRWIRSAVEAYERPLVRYAARITGDVERGRDVAQEAFLRLCRADRASIDGHLAEWLFTVCRNRALDVKRKETRMATLPADRAAEQPAHEPDQAVAAERRDTAEHVGRLLATLPENQQEVVRLKFQAGLSYREISRVTELSVSNVGYLLHTAIRKLREKLGADPELPDA